MKWAAERGTKKRETRSKREKEKDDENGGRETNQQVKLVSAVCVYLCAPLIFTNVENCKRSPLSSAFLAFFFLSSGQCVPVL